MADLALQNFVIARLSEYCDFHHYFQEYEDPVLYLWEKLEELKRPMCELKEQMLADAKNSFIKRIEAGFDDKELADFKHFLESYLSAGDMVDALFLLDPAALRDPARRGTAVDFLKNVTAHRMIDEENKPPEKRDKLWRRLTDEIYKRLEFERLEKALKHKPMSARRMRFILRRCRLNSAEYCTVFRFPKDLDDTFTPFILPRVEALIGVNERFLKFIRTAKPDVPSH